jgi:hypothetical protein
VIFVDCQLFHIFWCRCLKSHEKYIILINFHIIHFTCSWLQIIFSVKQFHNFLFIKNYIKNTLSLNMCRSRATPTTKPPPPTCTSVKVLIFFAIIIIIMHEQAKKFICANSNIRTF